MCELSYLSAGDADDNDCDGLLDEESVCYTGYGTTKLGIRSFEHAISIDTSIYRFVYFKRKHLIFSMIRKTNKVKTCMR